MNYGDLLYRAHENKCSVSNKQVRCYKTSFEPPKKLSKSKVSSDNIKKFLARKEEEEKRKLLEEQRKKSELLALRSQDKKAHKRVLLMLKLTKSANKSVMEDAIDNVNTADTLMGPNQCDSDDYGFVSQEASEMYDKLMKKYENMPPEPEFLSKKKKEVKDMAAAKDRVKLTLHKEAEEAELLPTRKKKSSKGGNDLIQDTDSEEEPAGSTSTDTTQKLKLLSVSNNESISSKKESTESVKPKIKKSVSTAPPPPDFNELLKIPKEKQHEPILIDTSARQKEPQRLMTSKEKAESMREEERKRNRLMKERNGVNRLKEPENKGKEQSKDQKETSQKECNEDYTPITTLHFKNVNKELFDIDKQIELLEMRQILLAYEANAVIISLAETSKKAEPLGLRRLQKLSQSKPKDETPIVDKQPSIPKKVQPERETKSIEKRLEKCSKVWQNVDVVLRALVPKYVPSAIKPRPLNPKEPSREKNVPKLLKTKPIKKRSIEENSEYDTDSDGPEAEEDYS